MKNFLLQKLGQILLHSIFWFGVFMFYNYLFVGDNNDILYVLSLPMILMPITIATTYVFLYKLIPNYLIKKRYYLFTLYLCYTLIISTSLVTISIFFCLIYLPNIEVLNMSFRNKDIVFIAISVYVVVILVRVFKWFRLNQINTKHTRDLENRLLKTKLKLKEQELNFLKILIDSHFLFNTLNTMYGFALKKADETPEIILKFSNLLDYLLNIIDKPFVSVKEEINYINDYLELEKMRFKDKVNISFITHNISEDLKIAPMILLPFIKNSFENDRLQNGQLNIIIVINCMDQNMLFSIENKKSSNEGLKKGIDLKNIKQRLNLLYPNNYTLKTVNENDHNKVILKLSLNL